MDECQCGDRRRDHTGPERRGSCLVCRGGVAPPDGPDGCQRFRLAFRVGEHEQYPSFANDPAQFVLDLT